MKKRELQDGPEPAHSEWIRLWLDGVVDGSKTMSQRKLSSIERRGGLRAVQQAAREKKVHLLLLEDDHGVKIVAAGKKPYIVVC